MDIKNGWVGGLQEAYTQKKWETMQPPYMQKVRDELRVYFNA